MNGETGRDAGSASPGTAGVRLQALGLPFGVVDGLNGTQIFSTAFATRDPGEPDHCGVSGGATYWFAYECPQTGILHFDTDGSEFPTVLAVYTFEPPLDSFDQLIAVACDVATAANPVSQVEFAAVAGRTYLAVLDGIDGARGLAQVNYRLVAPPVIRRGPASKVVGVGGRARLQIDVDPGIGAQVAWWKDGAPLVGRTGPELVLDACRPEDQGTYVAEITNGAGTLWTPPARLEVLASSR